MHIVDIITQDKILPGTQISGRVIGHVQFRPGKSVITSLVQKVWDDGYGTTMFKTFNTTYRANDPGMSRFLREYDKLAALLLNIIG